MNEYRVSEFVAVGTLKWTDLVRLAYQSRDVHHDDCKILLWNIAYLSIANRLGARLLHNVIDDENSFLSAKCITILPVTRFWCSAFCNKKYRSSHTITRFVANNRLPEKSFCGRWGNVLYLSRNVRIILLLNMARMCSHWSLTVPYALVTNDD